MRKAGTIAATSVAKKSSKKEDKGEFITGEIPVGQKVYIIKEVNADEIIREIESNGDSLSNDKKTRLKQIIEEENEMIKERKLSGVVFSRDELENGKFSLSINLGESYPFTTSISPYDELFPEIDFFVSIAEENCGYKEEDMIVSKTSEVKDDCGKFANFAIKKTEKSIEERVSDVLDVKSRMLSVEKEVVDLLRRLNTQKNTLQSIKISYNNSVDIIKDAMEGKMPEVKDYKSYYEGIFKNPDVESVKIIKDKHQEECLLLKTKELDYKDFKNHRADRSVFGVDYASPEFKIGGFYVLIYPNGTVKAVNYSRFIGTGHHQPCVAQDGDICMGSGFRDVLNKAISSGDYASAIHLTIDFLKNPNSNSPYRDSTFFMFSQERKFSPKDPLDLFGHSSKYNETWDKKRFNKEVKDFMKEKGLDSGSARTEEDDDDDDDEDFEDDDD